MKRSDFLKSMSAAGLVGLGVAVPASLASDPHDPIGTEYDYVEFDANVLVSHTQAQGADTILTGRPLTFDGQTRVRVEFWCQVVETPRNGYDFNLGLYEGDTIVRLLVGRYAATAGAIDNEAMGLAYFTPTAGTHTYSIRAYRSPGVTGTAVVAAGTGVDDDFPPGFYRITKASDVPPV